MISVFVSAKVKKCIQSLWQTGKAGRTMARKATAIIENLTSGDMWHNTKAVSGYTKNGEKRIRNCRKFDLGCGYRLITLQRGDTIFIPFLGNHDECQRWLEKNSHLTTFTAGKGNTIHIVEKKSSPTTFKDVDNMDVDEDANGFFQNLTDKDLRTVFRGLIEGVRKRLK